MRSDDGGNMSKRAIFASAWTGRWASIAARTAEVTGADVVVVRLVDDSGQTPARARCHAESAALRAELEGSRLSARGGPGRAARGAGQAAHGVAASRRAARREAACCKLPVSRGPTRSSGRWSCVAAGASSTGVSACSHSRLRTRSRWLGGLFGDGGGAATAAPDLLGLAGDALAAGSDEARAADQVATLAAEATGASACVVWRYEQQGPVLAALSGTALPPRSRSTPSAVRATYPARSRSSRWRRAAPW